MEKVASAIRRSGSGEREDGRFVEIAGLTNDEFDELSSMVSGAKWISVGEDGRLQSVPKFESPPSPIEDAKMLPFWRRASSEEMVVQIELIDPKLDQPPFSPSVVIQSLCGFGYTPESYQLQVERLESFGFDCLRSRRGKDGRYWEIWYLPGLWAAKGGLKDFLELLKGEGADARRKIDGVVSYLCQNVSFGTLDIVYQRAAMRNPE